MISKDNYQLVEKAIKAYTETHGVDLSKYYCRWIQIDL